jgi:uncharacterized small protein (DUF1192 family)
VDPTLAQILTYLLDLEQRLASALEENERLKAKNGKKDDPN